MTYNWQKRQADYKLARKQYNKQLIWFVIGFVAFVLIMGIVGHIELQDLTNYSL